MDEIRNLSEALALFRNELHIRHKEVVKMEKVVADRAGSYIIKHGRIWARHGDARELYHVKFAKEGYRLKPPSQLSSAAKELDEKLRFALRNFGRGDDTLNGLNEDIVLELVGFTEKGIDTFYVTVMSDNAVYVSSIIDFYNFVMRYDTFFKFPRSNVPVCEVPTGWMRRWTRVVEAPPSLALNLTSVQ